MIDLQTKRKNIEQALIEVLKRHDALQKEAPQVALRIEHLRAQLALCDELAREDGDAPPAPE